MKQIFAISLLLLVGTISLSTSKSDKLLGKWVMYKMTKDGKTRDMTDTKNIPWVTFAPDNVLWTGEGNRDKKRGKWWFDDVDKALYLVIQSREEPMKIKHLSKNKLILNIKNGRNTMKAHWKKVP